MMNPKKRHCKEWFWTRDDMASFIHKHQAGMFYTEQEILSECKRNVTDEEKREAYLTLFVPVAEESIPLLEIVNGVIIRTSQRPSYSD